MEDNLTKEAKTRPAAKLASVASQVAERWCSSRSSQLCHEQYTAIGMQLKPVYKKYTWPGQHYWQCGCGYILQMYIALSEALKKT